MDAFGLQENIFTVNEKKFGSLTLDIFRFQYAHNPVYREFCSALGKNDTNVTSVTEIPFLPVEIFKSHRVYAAEKFPQIVFTSSGTTGNATSRHEVADISLYKKSFFESFRKFYGDPRDWIILALLPSYLEREGSSLVFMAEELIKESAKKESGFFLDDYEKLSVLLKELNPRKRKIILLGVTYALLDLAEQFPQPLDDLVIMETGGMKGQRKEMVREEVHNILCNAFQVKNIHSEYGMTELLSQAYSKGEGVFLCPPWMKIFIREMNDPFSIAGEGKTGGVNIIDLANLYSCSFLSTSDLGKKYADESFEILGRFDDSDVRGCNLMVQ